jgi:hypothetical protein
VRTENRTSADELGVSQSTLPGSGAWGITQAEVAQRIGLTQGRVSAIEHAKPGATVQGWQGVGGVMKRALGR